jgi:hypothetical protein
MGLCEPICIDISWLQLAYLLFGPCKSSQWAALSLSPEIIHSRQGLYGPTRSRMAAHCVLDGPIRTNCLSTAVREMGPCEGVGQPRQPHPASCKRCGPKRRSPVAAHCTINGPIRTNCPNTLMDAMGPHDGVVRQAAGSPWCDRWANSN